MPRERNSVKIDLAITANDDVQDFIVRMLRKKIADMDFEREGYELELSIANDQKKVSLSNGRKYSELYKEKLKRLSVELDNFESAIELIKTTEFKNDCFVNTEDKK